MVLCNDHITYIIIEIYRAFFLPFYYCYQNFTRTIFKYFTDNLLSNILDQL